MLVIKICNLIKKYKYEILIFLFFILVRLPSLGSDIFNTDVWKWKARTYDFGTGIFTLDFEKTIQKYHPGVTLMWIGTFAVKAFNLYARYINIGFLDMNNISAVFALHFFQKLFLTIFIAFVVSSIFHVLKELFGAKTAFYSVIFFTLEPFYVALTRVYHLEGLMSTLMIASALWLYWYLGDKKNYKLIFSAVFAGLSILTKTSALYMVLFSALVMFLYDLRKTGNLLTTIKSTFFVYLKWLMITALVVFLLWPGLWTHFSIAMAAINKGINTVGIEGDHYQIYMGDLVADPGPWYYFVVLALRSSVFLLAGLFIGFFVFKKLEPKKKEYVAYLFIFSIFYLAEITIPTKKLDRYVLPTMISLSMVSAIFLENVISKIKPQRYFSVTFVFILLVNLFYYHPSYFSYYNPLFGGLKKGIYILEPKWMIGQKEISDFFEKVQENGKYLKSFDSSFEDLVYGNTSDQYLTVGFQEKYYTQIWPFIRKFGAWPVLKELRPFAVKTEYFVYPVWNDDHHKDTRVNLEYFDSIKLRGVTVYNVYRNIGKPEDK